MEHRQQTDQVKKIQLPSSIERVAWTTRMASNGALVGLEIVTHFVGNRSELEIELSDQSGKKIGKYKEKISGNRFWTQIKVPADAKQALYADVKLPKHSIQLKSGPMIILSAIEITNLKWDKKEARRGDIVKLTADVKNVPDGTEGEISIWEHDSDAAHDLVTQFPVLIKSGRVEAEWEYEYHEDTDEIPTAEETEKGYQPPEYFFRIIIYGLSAESGLLEFRDWVRITLVDYNGSPVPDREYRFKLPDGSERRERLDSRGSAEMKDISPGRIRVFIQDKS